ncbi:MAG: VanW family protein [Clostridia bacterium]|nr:VanW family protein [Clostridia bacterium]MBT7123224.1 VanW family protein [Clostridia bacterium]
MNVNMSKKSRKSAAKRRGRITSISAAVAIAVVAVVTLAVLGGAGVPEHRIERIIDYGTITRGVSVNGVDIGGMSEEQAREATKGIESELLEAAVYTLDVDGEIVSCDAQALSLSTDYAGVIEMAVSFGRAGTFDERKVEIDIAKAGEANFGAALVADETFVAVYVAQLKSELDKDASGAGYEFMPWGYFEADGSAYEPDMEAMIVAFSKKEDYVYPEGLARIEEPDMPSELRYQYYRGDQYWRVYKPEEGVYLPPDANIARFKYAQESKGITIDAAGTVDVIMAAVANGETAVISVPCEVTHTQTSVEQARANTQLITSWTSRTTHSSSGRMYNVGKLSGIICGVEILPGETWSINEEAGVRLISTGWKDAIGYTGGVSVPQPGGGVCQISSTVYNAALRAGLDYTEDIDSKRHSTVSDYITIGLDATISSPNGPELDLTNPYDYPIYIVSYMTGEHYNVTVEIYGRPPVDDTGKEIIYDFSSREMPSGEAPAVVYHYDVVVTPPPTNLPILEGEYIEVGFSQPIKKASVYRTVYDLDGNIVVEKTFYYEAKYPKKTLHIYCNFPMPLISGDPLVPDPPEDPEDPEDPGNSGGNNGNSGN